MCTFRDGSIFKENKLIQEREGNCVIFMLHFDEMNFTDTTSPRPIKLGMIYLSTANMHSRYRSKLICINLLSAVPSDMNAYNFNEMLSPVVEDLKTFENGVLMADGSVAYGTLLAVIGDNPASHKLGGLK